MVVIQQMLVLFIVMLVGLAAYKKDIITDETSKKISSLVVNISNPALILSSVLGDNSKIQMQTLEEVMGISILMYVLLMIGSIGIPKLLKVEQKDKGLYKIMFVFSNIGFMGLPIVSSLYGTESLLYASLFLFPYNILIYTYGIQVIGKPQGAPKEEKNWKTKCRNIFNNGVIASIVALLLFMMKWQLPECITSSISMIGGLTSPLSMMVIGASLATMDLKAMVRDVRLIIFSAIKLLFVPIICAFFIKHLINDAVIGGIILVMLATPVGSMTAILAQEYDGNYELTSKGVALTTILSVATIPIVFYLFELM